MSLWDWAAATYARPGVSQACLDLQDGHQQNVCFLLWAMWANPESDALRAGVGMAREWETIVLKPLRGVRRRLPA
ncbi:MAG TPA: TIGR02444 family protein, partial [Caulobacteraceae bacterium]